MNLYAAAPTYLSLLVAIRARRVELGLSQLAVDHLAGMPSGYQAKLEARLTNPTATNARSIGIESLPLVMNALGLHLALVAEPRQRENTSQKNAGLGRVSRDIGEIVTQFPMLPTNRIMAEKGKSGARRRMETTTPEQRQASARQANAARWAKARAAAPIVPPADPVPPRPDCTTQPDAPATIAPRLRPPVILSKFAAAQQRKQNVLKRAAARQSANQ